MKSPTLAEYTPNFRVARATILALPICGSTVIPQAAMLFPPLGEAQAGKAFLGTLLIGVLSLIPWKIERRKSLNLLLLGSILLAITTLCFCVKLNDSYVVGAYAKQPNRTLYVSIGSSRTPVALDRYPGWSDHDMIKDRGPYNDEVYFLYTADSIRSARLRLFCSYVSFFSSIGIIAGIFAKENYRRGLLVKSGIASK